MRIYYWERSSEVEARIASMLNELISCERAMGKKQVKVLTTETKKAKGCLCVTKLVCRSGILQFSYSNIMSQQQFTAALLSNIL